MPKKYLSLIVLIPLLHGCSDHDTHDHSQLTTGKSLYDHHCSICHGMDGTGLLADNTPSAILTQRNLDGIVQYLRHRQVSNREMPLFENMPVSEARLIAKYLLELKQSYYLLPDEKRKNPALMIKP